MDVFVIQIFSLKLNDGVRPISIPFMMILHKTEHLIMEGFLSFLRLRVEDFLVLLLEILFTTKYLAIQKKQ